MTLNVPATTTAPYPPIPPVGNWPPYPPYEPIFPAIPPTPPVFTTLPPFQPTPGPGPKRWEYLVQLLVGPLLMNDQNNFNRFGAEGWELIQIHDGHAVFKRELP